MHDAYLSSDVDDDIDNAHICDSLHSLAREPIPLWARVSCAALSNSINSHLVQWGESGQWKISPSFPGRQLILNLSTRGREKTERGQPAYLLGQIQGVP